MNYVYNNHNPFVLNDLRDVFFQDRLSLIKDGDNPLNTSAARRDIQSRISIMIDAVDYVSDIAVFDGEAIQHHGSGISLSDEEFRKAVDRAMALEMVEHKDETQQ